MEAQTPLDAVDKIGELEREVQALSMRLEAASRLVRRVAAVATCSLAVVVFAGGAALVAEQFSRVEVLGPKNDVRVRIDVNPQNSGAGIGLLDVNGVLRLGIGVNPQG